MLDSKTNVVLANFFVVQGSAAKLRFRSEMVLCTGPKHFMLWKCIAELLGLAFGYKLVMCDILFLFHYFFFNQKIETLLSFLVVIQQYFVAKKKSSFKKFKKLFPRQQSFWVGIHHQ